MGRFAFVLEQTLGHGAHARNLRRALDRQTGIEPTVIELGFETASPALRHVPLLSSWSLRASIAARAALRSRVRLGALDGIFVHTQTASLLLGGLMKDIPTVISLDATPKNFDTVGRGYGHQAGLAAVEGAKTAMYRRTLRAADELVVWCQWAAGSLVSDYGITPHKIHVIPPGVDLDLFQPSSSERRPGPVRVLFVGGDFARKGGQDLLAAMTMLDGAELDVVTSEQGIEIPEGVRCRIHRGLAPQSEALLRLYAEADIFALPSRSDCLPQALAEAAASGLPMVATRVGAMPEIVADGVNGLLVESASPQSLASGLRTLIGNASLRKRLGAQGRQTAEQKHDANRNNSEIFGLLHRAAQRRRSVEPTAVDAAMESA
ncbi:MAG TPA: glycosyltransferase family 4 protein [Candidatus Limnocylindrales bacterium]|nr:glycosyltransferase family 4 protein [Candidatus Limnocylindrales bacterium]